MKVRQLIAALRHMDQNARVVCGGKGPYAYNWEPVLSEAGNVVLITTGEVITENLWPDDSEVIHFQPDE